MKYTTESMMFGLFLCYRGYIRNKVTNMSLIKHGHIENINNTYENVCDQLRANAELHNAYIVIYCHFRVYNENSNQYMLYIICLYIE